MIGQDIELEIQEEARVKTKIASLSAELATIKNRMLGSGRIPDGEFRQLSKKRAEIVCQCQQLQSRMSQIKANKHMRALSEHEAKANIKEAMTDSQQRLALLIRSVSMLRAVYKDQSIDGTRTDAVRFMANKFQEDLGKIIVGEL